MAIRQVAVIGAGVMGAAIAAHISNAGVKVILLDIVAKDNDNRNALADGAVATMLKASPAPFMHKRNARLIKTGNIEDDLGLLSEADWIIEAVIERLDIKQALYQKIASVCHDDAIISSNTSTIPLATLLNGMPAHFQSHFVITHFFNPPRYMRLFERVSGPDTLPSVITTLDEFADVALGKGVVVCNDTPGFIGNRIGIFWLQCAVQEAFKLDISIEVADAVVGPPMGIPKTGVFGLLDLVGLDLMPHILSSMVGSLPPDDAFQAVANMPPLVDKMIADGYTGRKGKGGFYRLAKQDGKRLKEAIDLRSGDYHEAVKPRLDCIGAMKSGGLQALLEHQDEAGVYAWRVLARTLCYAVDLLGEVSDDVAAIDEAMRLGFNWQKGPFELIDQLGVSWFVERLRNVAGNDDAGINDAIKIPQRLISQAGNAFYRQQEGVRQRLCADGQYHTLTYRSGIMMLEDIKRQGAPVLENDSASLWDIGDGVACLEFHTKANTLDAAIMSLIQDSIERVSADFKALVIYNDADNFSAGANLGLFQQAAEADRFDEIEALVRLGQDTYQALKYSPFPVVGAPSGLALGGGCEILLHCDAIQAHAETYMGLVEVGVGLVPGWGGCKEMLRRWTENPKRAGGMMPVVSKAFEVISMATVSMSAEQARDHGYMRAGDGITMNRMRLLSDAKAHALRLVEQYVTPTWPEMHLPGPSAQAALLMAIDSFRLAGKATAHDVVVGTGLAQVLSGGSHDMMDLIEESELLALEVDAFMALARNPDTIARITHMLSTGKPLRN